MSHGSDLAERSWGATTVLFGERGGKYPHGNSLVVRGSEESLIVDPSLGVVARSPRIPVVDRVVLSHCHEDHIAGLHLYPGVPCHVHEADRSGLRGLDDFMAIYGFDGVVDAAWRAAVLENFHYVPRPDAGPLRDGDVFELGGGVRLRVIHAPGHTRGHCAFHVEPDDLLYLGDIDLSSFGPYYGDAWSSLAAFEHTLGQVRAIEARLYATFHHVGVLEGRAAFLERLDRFRGVIADRERRLLAYLAEPRGLDEIVAHRFVYRPGDAVSFADPVERRSMAQHLERLLGAGRLTEVEPGRFRAL